MNYSTVKCIISSSLTLTGFLAFRMNNYRLYEHPLFGRFIRGFNIDFDYATLPEGDADEAGVSYPESEMSSHLHPPSHPLGRGVGRRGSPPPLLPNP